MSCTNYGVWAGSGMNCSCLVSDQWFVTDTGEQISKSRAEDERAAFAEVRGRLEKLQYILCRSVQRLSASYPPSFA